MEKVLYEEIACTDVLVGGAGAGGLMAAISAADHGARVILCEKGNAKRSGGITGGNDHFACYIPEIHGPIQREKLIRGMLNRGLVDEDLIIKQIDFSYDVLRKWEDWGINMKRDGHYEFTGHAWPGSSGKLGEPGKTDRDFVHFSDNELCPKLERQALERGVIIMNRVMLTELLTDINGHVIGAIGISTREPKLHIFQAKAVVLNKGDVHPSRLYPSPDLIGYGMAQPGTGDGVIMAYRAGASLQNAEFFRQQVSIRFGPYAGKGTWIGVVRDAEGRPIAPPYLSKPDAELGDVSIENIDALDHVWEIGKGPVWMDPRGISVDEEQYMRWGFNSEALTPFLRWLDSQNIDIKKTRFEFTPRQPGTHMQARVDANYMTTVEKLYAIITNMGLAGSAVGGFIAGEAAAKDAQNATISNLEKYRDKILQLKQQYEEFLNRDGLQFADWPEAQWAIWQTMKGYALPPGRTEKTLMAGYNHLLRLIEQARHIIKASNEHDLYHCLEVLNLLDIAKLVFLAVIERKESRGQARRLDYPFTNQMLNKFLVITDKGGKPTFTWQEPRRVH